VLTAALLLLWQQWSPEVPLVLLVRLRGSAGVVSGGVAGPAAAGWWGCGVCAAAAALAAAALLLP
jgi:hypothetical protein